MKFFVSFPLPNLPRRNRSSSWAQFRPNIHVDDCAFVPNLRAADYSVNRRWNSGALFCVLSEDDARRMKVKTRSIAPLALTELSVRMGECWPWRRKE